MKVGASDVPSTMSAVSDKPPAQPPPRRSFVEVLGESRSPPPPAPSGPPHGPARAPAPLQSAWRELAQDTLDAEKRIDTILKAAASGKTFSPAELVAMQAQVFRYSQTVEVISRATEKLIGAVKQTLGTQV